MKTYKFPRTNDNIYYDVLDNGLSICIIPNKNYPNYCASLGVFYGSCDLEFVPKGKKKFVKTNSGIAHFLEHKKFEMSDLVNANDFFSENGAGCNASTSFKETKYYIWGSEKFKENFNHLLTYVFTPYFDEESVKNEIGIINEEIKMYDDEPGWIIDETSKKMLFNILPIKEKIAGTYETISKITAAELYECYNTFYVPNNMFLIVSGNVSVEDVMDVIEKKGLSKIEPNDNIKRKEYQESDLVKEEYKELKLNIIIPKVKYCFKINTSNFNLKDKLKLDMYINIIESIIFGATSDFCEKVKKENIVEDYYVGHYLYDKYLILEFNAESDKSDLFKEMVDMYLKNMKIEEKDLERMKRVWIASEIRISDKSDILAESLLDDFFEYKRLCYDRINIVETLNIEELNGFLKDLTFNNNCFLLANPKDN